jgi:H+-transporting ATPase
VFSITMALGALALSKEKAIVSRLAAIEEMAGVDILCSDKTGTLTKNQLTVGEPILIAAKNAQDVVLAGALASKADDRDAIDGAVIAALKNADALQLYRQTDFVPFDGIETHAGDHCRRPWSDLHSRQRRPAGDHRPRAAGARRDRQG